MAGGRIHGAGAPGEILTADMVQEVFGLQARMMPDPVSGRPMMIPVGRHRRAEG